MQENSTETISGSAVQAAGVSSIRFALSKQQKHVVSLLGQFLFGGVGYACMEIFHRGFTHISMFFAGGLSFLALVKLSKSKMNLFVQCLLGAATITVLEFIIGCIVNLWLGLGVWDYTGEAFHLLGQICPRLSSLWFAICLGVIPLCKKFQTVFH